MVTGSARLGPLSHCTANCRPVLSSERAPHRYKTATFRQQPSYRNQYLVTSSGVGSTPRHTDWPTVSRKVTSTSLIDKRCSSLHHALSLLSLLCLHQSPLLPCSRSYRLACPTTRIWTLVGDRRSVGQSILVSGSHLEPMTRFQFSVWQLWVSWCWALSLTKG
jgi:hypothetical protein